MSKKHALSSSTCSICSENILVGVILHKSRRITHKLCKECFETYIAFELEKILTKVKNNIRQPEIYSIQCCGSYHGEYRNNCKYNLDIFTLFSEVENKDTRYQLYILSNIRDYPSDVLCPICPITKYLKGYPKDSKNDSVTCLDCNHNWCRKCLTTPYHKGLTCQENQAKEDTTENGKLIWEKKMKGILKFCPTCNTPTEKETDINGNFTGCNKMSCAVCLTRWCWLCNEKNINYDHFTTSINCANRLWEGVEIID
jgi:hypothetical protein